MARVGIRSLKQNASAVVANAASGETVTITDRGRPVAQMTAIPSVRDFKGSATPVAHAPRAEASAHCLLPKAVPACLDEVAAMRDAERY